MKVNCIYTNPNILIGKRPDETLSFLGRSLLTLGITFNSINIIQNSSEQILSCLKKDHADLTIIIGTDDSKENFKIKSALADHYKLSMERNLNAVKAVDNYFTYEKKSPVKDVENEYYMPKTAMCLDNAMSYLQGMAMFRDGIVVLVPDDLDSVKYLFNNSLFPIVTKEIKVAYDVTMLKLFGLPEREILNAIKEITSANPDILISTVSEDLETTLIIRYNMLIEKERINNFISDIYERLRKFIFTSDDVSLYQLALDLLTIGNKKLSIFETITGGNISSEFNKCNFKGDMITDGVVVNNQTTLLNSYNVNANIIKKHGLVSVESTYEIASAILEKRPDDTILVTCGDLQDESHTCFIAIGDADGIHVYKNTYSGNKDQVVKTISKCAVFYLVKKLKQNDLFFNKIYV